MAQPTSDPAAQATPGLTTQAVSGLRVHVTPDPNDATPNPTFLASPDPAADAAADPTVHTHNPTFLAMPDDTVDATADPTVHTRDPTQATSNPTLPAPTQATPVTAHATPGPLPQDSLDPMSSTEFASRSKPEPNSGGGVFSRSSPSLRSSRSIWAKLWGRMGDDVRPSSLAEMELIVLTFCTGVQDAVTFPDYHCFASNQTGNTVFLMLALVLPHLNGEMFYVENIAVALGWFLAGGLVTGQVGHRVGPRRRWFLVLCNFVQAWLVFAAATLQYIHGVHMQGASTLAVISLLALASGSQVVQSRSLGITEISTAMATAAWVDFLIDPRLLAAHNRARSRRGVFLLTLIVGALVGAWIYWAAGSATAVVVSASGKMLVSVLYMFNEAEERQSESDRDSETDSGSAV